LTHKLISHCPNSIAQLITYVKLSYVTWARFKLQEFKKVGN